MPPKLRTRTIYLDLDGVFADFETHYLNTFGHSCKSVSDNEMWKNIRSVKNFFRDIPVFPGAEDFMFQLKIIGAKLAFLTACDKQNYAECALDKRAWIRERLCETTPILPMMSGKNKFVFMHQKDDLLVDDFEKNLTLWVHHGGIGIQHTGDYHMTLHGISYALTV
ncbi:5'-3' deoxyribonucleotidase [Sinorhizobium phage phiM9]|uniref:Putative DNA repair exonuclease n=1 Tax=Sinorhizobium phage phiM9 TaxID=1636182 RepID=A0A0F6TH64_9CAUD|nr:5'-3' deoxyribonucleotidase [Sinorhizobium phage phiM9]AKE44804.1 putative DNA repair exonuclease [Sinorhizobium phage phiM9]